MLYSHNTELALRAVLYLALQPPGKLTPAHAIARGTGLPRPYLAKILWRLSRAGLVRTFRGPGGGVELGRAPESITLWSVVQATEGAAQSERCVLGLRACSEETPCPLHHQWFPLRQEIQRLLKETTLASLVNALRSTAGPGPNSWLLVEDQEARETSTARQTGRWS